MWCTDLFIYFEKELWHAIWYADQKELCPDKTAFQLGETKWRSELIVVEELADELWLGKYPCEQGLISICFGSFSDKYGVKNIKTYSNGFLNKGV